MKNSEFIELHPLIANAAKIAEKGVAVIKEVRSLPFSGQPFSSPYYILSLCQSGKASAKYDMQPVVFSAYDIAIIYPNHIIEAENVSSDYCATLLVITDEFLKRISLVAPFKNRLSFQLHPSFVLSETQFRELYRIFETVDYISNMNYHSRDITLQAQIEVLAHIIDAFKKSNPDKQQRNLTHQQQIVIGFYEAISVHYKQSHSVSFYARLQCLSPKYFGTIVKKETGMNASECIEKHIITLAKTLLRMRRELSIQQISEKLGFDVQADFCRYFKKAEKMSPSQYRLMAE